MISNYNRLSGLEKVAILFSVLGESLALNLVKDLDKTDVRKIRAAMRGVESVAFSVKKQVMEEFYFSFVSEKFQESDGSDEPKSLLPFLGS
jgi:flagellar motor switch protein FliG